MSHLNQDIAEGFALSATYKRNLVYCKQYKNFYLSQGDDHFVSMSSDDVKDLVFDFIHTEFPKKNISTNFIKDIVGLLKHLCVRKINLPDTNYISFNDCYLNLQTLEPEVKDRENKTVIYSQPYDYESLQTTPTPVWDNYLKTSLVTEFNFKPDEELKSLVQEMLGFFLIDNLKGAGAFFLIGTGANGKSVMTDVVNKMIGEEFVSAMTIRSLTLDKFSTVHLIGKKVNISNEEESRYMQSDTFKALITGEMIQGERKFEDKVEFRPRTKYIFATNDMPTFDALNYGLQRRLKIVPFYKRFEDKDQDKELSEKLYQEMPGILWWAIEGARRLIKQCYVFTVPGSSERELKELSRDISSSVMFIDDQCEVDRTGEFKENWITNADMYAYYTDWCTENGKKRKSSNIFLKDIMRNVAGVKSERLWRGGKNIRGKNIYLLNANNPDIIVEDLSQDALDGM